MKNVIMIVLAIMFLGTSSLMAQKTEAQARMAEEEKAVQQDERKEISAADLPAPVVTTLAGENFREWTIRKVYKIKRGDSELYEVSLTNGSENVTVTLDKNGNLIR